MLELTSIIKDYPAGGGKVEALRGIDLSFRRQDFVTILGPSGCGKTTLLNIIGGLDQYTSGDLIIDGVSTKAYKDRDWDAYRNHSIGFVFQSYNLIPHQSVLKNVEIALTVSGVSKGERRRRAIDALTQVGLGDQIRKRPNQLSGGQMQRVAIARALVNDPDIILADEPTGALDTDTSQQVMDILKEISKKRLIIMVTHNPILADKYATRVIQMLDGKITEDSSPLTPAEMEAGRRTDAKARQEKKRDKKPSMSIFTAFMLSLTNLFTKKGRTTLTAFAGSIGIMGIALILAVSTGTTAYIDAVQEDALSAYPLTIESSTIDLSDVMQSFMGAAQEGRRTHDKDAVYKKSAIYNMLTAISNIDSRENDLASFKAYLEEAMADGESGLSDAITGVQYTYAPDLPIYTKGVDGNILRADSQLLLQEIMASYMGMDAGAMASMMDSNPMMSNFASMDMLGASSMGMMNGILFQEMLGGRAGEPVHELLTKQYDVLSGTWPNAYDEVVLVLDRNNELDDMTLYALGLEERSAVEAIMSAAFTGTAPQQTDARWTYEEILDTEFKILLSADSYVHDENTGTYTDLRETEAGLRFLYEDALTLKVVGIIRPNEDAQSAMLGGAIGYTHLLTEHIILEAGESPLIAAQMENPETDILTGLPFAGSQDALTDEEKAQKLTATLSILPMEKKAETYARLMASPTEEQLAAMTAKAMADITPEEMEAAMVESLTQRMGMDATAIMGYLSTMSEEDMEEMFSSFAMEYAAEAFSQEADMRLSAMEESELAAALDMTLTTLPPADLAALYDDVMAFSPSTYEENLIKLGYVDLDTPQSLSIYASSFGDKDIIEEAIAAYNEGVEELSRIRYTDYIGIILSSVTTIINAITYVLLAFVAISLVVSSIMIGVITLISVQERTKEIGILRAIGASKGDVSHMFNAETLIIGCTSGLIGIGVTYLLCIPINALLHSITGIQNLSAYLPPRAAVILVLISMGLSMVAGLIPSRSAAKKDPVVALRTE